MCVRRPFLLGAVLAVGASALGLTGCGEDTPDAERLAEDLMAESDGALDEAQATCVAEGLEAAFGDDAYRAILDAAENDDVPDAEVSPDVRVEVIDIFAGCDALGAAVLDGS